MKRILTILLATAAVLGAAFVATMPLHVGYYADWNGLLGELRARVLDDPPAGDRMCVEYGRLVQRLCAQNGTGGP